MALGWPSGSFPLFHVLKRVSTPSSTGTIFCAFTYSWYSATYSRNKSGIWFLKSCAAQPDLFSVVQVLAFTVTALAIDNRMIFINPLRTKMPLPNNSIGIALSAVHLCRFTFKWKRKQLTPLIGATPVCSTLFLELLNIGNSESWHHLFHLWQVISWVPGCGAWSPSKALSQAPTINGTRIRRAFTVYALCKTDHTCWCAHPQGPMSNWSWLSLGFRELSKWCAVHVRIKSHWCFHR